MVTFLSRAFFAGTVSTISLVFGIGNEKCLHLTNWGEYKMPVGSAPTNRHFVLSPCFARINKPKWRPLELNDRSTSTTSRKNRGDCEQSNCIIELFFPVPFLKVLVVCGPLPMTE